MGYVYNPYAALATMLNYYGGFMYHENNSRNMSDAFLEQCNQQEHRILQDALGFQTAMMLKLRPFMRARPWDNKAMCYNMCIYNLHSLYTANDILKSDNFHVFYAIIRIVFESFPKLFYCMADKEGATHVFCCEEFFYRRKAAQKSDKNTESYCKSVKRPIDGENCKYVKDSKWFRKEVYTDDRQHGFNKQHALYSVGSHPNIATIDARTRDDLKYGWTVSLDIITYYSLMNLFIMVNVVAEELKMCFEFDHSKWFVKDRMQKVWGSLGESILRLYPDKEKYSRGLPFALPIGV